MRFVTAVFAVLCLASIASGQYKFPPVQASYIPPPILVDDTRLERTYSDAYYEAFKLDKKLAVFIGTSESKMDGAVTFSVSWYGPFKQFPEKSIVVSEKRGDCMCITSIVDLRNDGSLSKGQQRQPIMAPPVFMPSFRYQGGRSNC